MMLAARRHLQRYNISDWLTASGKGRWMMFCKNCGSELKPDAAFCGSCGVDLKQAPAQLKAEPVADHVPRWFDNQVTVVVLLIFFPPLGLYALWENSTFTPNAKLIVTGIVVVLGLVWKMSDSW